jgi:hypothetical protein
MASYIVDGLTALEGKMSNRMEPFMLVVNDARQKMALLNDHNTQIEHIYHKMQEKVSLDQFELLHDKLINEYSTVLQL